MLINSLIWFYRRLTDKEIKLIINQLQLQLHSNCSFFWCVHVFTAVTLILTSVNQRNKTTRERQEMTTSWCIMGKVVKCVCVLAATESGSLSVNTEVMTEGWGDAERPRADSWMRSERAALWGPAAVVKEGGGRRAAPQHSTQSDPRTDPEPHIQLFRFT